MAIILRLVNQRIANRQAIGRTCRLGLPTTTTNLYKDYKLANSNWHSVQAVKISHRHFSLTFQNLTPERSTAATTTTYRPKPIKICENISYCQSTTLDKNGGKRKLVVLLSWLEAKERHIDKYRQLYLLRGYDVLNLKTSTMGILLPNIGARKVAKQGLEFMKKHQYEDVLLHQFSVGAYMFGKVLSDIEQEKDKELRERLLNSFKGIILDSMITAQGFQVGVANSVTRNKFLANGLSKLFGLYASLFHSVSMKYLVQISDKNWDGPLNRPSLFFISRDDIISNGPLIERLADGWSAKGIDVRKVVVDDAPHVQLYNTYSELYEKEVEDFLRYIEWID